jgi:hypothetical protein
MSRAESTPPPRCLDAWRALLPAHLDFAPLRDEPLTDALRAEAKLVWQERVWSEYRSAQVMQRFATELMAAGAPLAQVNEAQGLVAEELRHVALCAATLDALGGIPSLPAVTEVSPPAPYRDAPAIERALATALSMLVVNETLSMAFIEDLAAQASHPTVAAVLRATGEDEATHAPMGVAMTRHLLQRAGGAGWSALISALLAPQHERARRALDGVPAAERTLNAQLDPARARLGLLTQTRRALLFQRAWRERLRPTLDALGLLGDTGP